MAVTATIIGQANPNRQKIDQGGVTQLGVFVADVTIGATSDYSSGITITPSTVNVNTIFGIVVDSIRQSAGTVRGGMFPLWDVANAKVRVYQQASGTVGGTLTEISGSNLAAGDIMRCVVIGA